MQMQTIWDLQRRIETGWSQLQQTSTNAPQMQHASLKNDDDLVSAISETLRRLDRGQLQVATNWANKSTESDWITNDWIKKAILLSFRSGDCRLIDQTQIHPQGSGNAGALAFDKVPLKFAGWTASDFDSAKLRVVPGAIVRFGAHLGKGVVLMPSFVNIGARVGANTMVDTWASIGSGAQVGSGCHISAGAGIGGVLEPVQARPTIIEDECFIGARSEIVEGVVVGRGSVIAMGVFITQSTKIVDRESGEVFQGKVPPYSVVVPGTLPGKDLPDGRPGPALSCAVIVKQVDARTRAKTAVNDLLRF